MAEYTSVNPIGTEEGIWGTLKPYGGFDYPVAHSQHSLGGLMSVPTITSTIPPLALREEGLIVFQESNETYYMNNAQGAWDEIQETHGSNGLYQYEKTRDSNGATIEMYFWDNGKLEYFIAFPETSTHVKNGNIWYNSSYRVTFPIPFHSFDDMVAVADSTSPSSGTGEAWASIRDINISSIMLYICGTHNTTRGTGNVSVYGTWK